MIGAAGEGGEVGLIAPDIILAARKKGLIKVLLTTIVEAELFQLCNRMRQLGVPLR
jgi:hypothetical protein